MVPFVGCGGSVGGGRRFFLFGRVGARERRLQRQPGEVSRPRMSGAPLPLLFWENAFGIDLDLEAVEKGRARRLRVITTIDAGVK